MIKLHHLKLLFSNLKTLCKLDINNLQWKINTIEAHESTIDSIITQRFHYLNVLNYFTVHPLEAEPYFEELTYLKNNGHYCNFPYNIENSRASISAGIDNTVGLPYVLHNGHKLFFPVSYNIESSIKTYENLAQIERLLGVQEIKKSPHQYQSELIQICDGDVLFDIGCAEGLFGLDNIEKTSHTILVENNPLWIPALNATFREYKDKVTIINKKIGTDETPDTTTLNNLITTYGGKSNFLKMDIEGSEVSTISSFSNYLKSSTNQIKLSIASYHLQNDYDSLKKILEASGYMTQTSTGFMLFYLYDIPIPPYFRHGIIRAIRNNNK